MKISSSKTLGITADIITIANFLISLIPIATTSDNWPDFFSSGIRPEFRFIVFTIFTLICSYTFVRLASIVDMVNAFSSSKMTLVALGSVAFAWVVVFNMRFIALNNDLSDHKYFLFIFSAWAFSFFSSVKLHYDFKEKGYKSYDEGLRPFWVDNSFYTPVYIRVIRFLSYWFIVIIGGLVYQF